MQAEHINVYAATPDVSTSVTSPRAARLGQLGSAAGSAVGAGTARMSCCRHCWLWTGLSCSLHDPKGALDLPFHHHSCAGLCHAHWDALLPPAVHWLVLLTFSFLDLCNTQRAEAACREAERQETQAAWIPMGFPGVSQTRKLLTFLLLPPIT